MNLNNFFIINLIRKTINQNKNMDRKNKGGGIGDTLLKVGIGAIIGIGAYLVTKKVEKIINEGETESVQVNEHNRAA